MSDFWGNYNSIDQDPDLAESKVEAKQFDNQLSTELLEAWGKEHGKGKGTAGRDVTMDDGKDRENELDRERPPIKRRSAEEVGQQQKALPGNQSTTIDLTGDTSSQEPQIPQPQPQPHPPSTITTATPNPASKSTTAPELPSMPALPVRKRTAPTSWTLGGAGGSKRLSTGSGIGSINPNNSISSSGILNPPTTPSTSLIPTISNTAIHPHIQRSNSNSNSNSKLRETPTEQKSREGWEKLEKLFVRASLGKTRNGDGVVRSSLLSGMVCFYTAGNLGIVLGLVKSTHQLGGRSLRQFNPQEVTHVIVADGNNLPELRNLLRVKSLKDLPEGCVCVRAEWLALCKSKNEIIPLGNWQVKEPTPIHRTVSRRVTKARTPPRRHEKTDSDTTQSQQRPPPPTLSRNPTARVPSTSTTGVGVGAGNGTVIPDSNDDDERSDRSSSNERRDSPEEMEVDDEAGVEGRGEGAEAEAVAVAGPSTASASTSRTTLPTWGGMQPRPKDDRLTFNTNKESAANDKRFLPPEKGEKADGLDQYLMGLKEGIYMGEVDSDEDVVLSKRGLPSQSRRGTGHDSDDDDDDDDDETDDECESDKAEKRKALRQQGYHKYKESAMNKGGMYKAMQANDGQKGPSGANDWLAGELDKGAKLAERAKHKDMWQKLQWRKAASAARNCPYPITGGKMAREIKNIGENMSQRIDEILKGSKFSRAAFEDTPQARAVTAFGKIYGVGTERAHELWNLGARSMEDLKNPANHANFRLTEGNKAGIKYYDDLNERIPRAEVTQLFALIESEARLLDPGVKIDAMGSYRRGENTSGDLDVLITRDNSDGITHAGLMKRLVDTLTKKGILEFALGQPHDWNDLECKWMGCGRVSPTGKLRRIDLLAIPYEQYGAALIYFTGNDIFNRSLRLYARKNGYSLNQRGLYKDVIRDQKTKLKTTEGTIVASRTEEEIFAVLGIRWRPPHLRRP